MTERFNIQALLSSRAAQRSYHVAAEQHVRIEFRNLASGEVIEPFAYGGDVVLTCYRGVFSVCLGGEDPFPIAELDQVVIPAETSVQLECRDNGTIQIIWAPAQAPTMKGATSATSG